MRESTCGKLQLRIAMEPAEACGVQRPFADFGRAVLTGCESHRNRHPDRRLTARDRNSPDLLRRTAN
jgi:hypothetical protein